MTQIILVNSVRLHRAPVIGNLRVYQSSQSTTVIFSIDIWIQVVLLEDIRIHIIKDL